MRKTLLALATLTLVLTGCGSTDTTSNADNSAVLAEIASMREEMNSGFERVEAKVDTVQTTTPQENVSSTETAPAKDETSSEEVTTSEELETATQDEATPTEAPATSKLQVSVIHCENRIPVRLVEGKISEDCMNNPTDLNSPTGTHRDLHFLFVGEKIKEAYWIYGESQERSCELSPTIGDDGISYLYFDMEEGNGIYNFQVVTESGKVYSFSVKYYYDNII